MFHRHPNTLLSWETRHPAGDGKVTGPGEGPLLTVLESSNSAVRHRVLNWTYTPLLYALLCLSSSLPLHLIFVVSGQYLLYMR